MWVINGLQRDFLNSGTAIGLWLARDGSPEACASRPVDARGLPLTDPFRQPFGVTFECQRLFLSHRL
ncbi:hypothetical protein BCAR13_310024 [Paraburkholderia caribensis]|nr:hypothetical protein BCAR13_310024 [Paraburkholderia caribensis]